MTRTQTSYVADRIVARYVEEIQSGPASVAADVIAEIGGDRTEIIWELLALTHQMGLREGKESEDDFDAWWDAMDALLPRIAEALAVTS